MRGEPNRFIGKNYIPDNPRMEVPPSYWLQRLWDFDADLVVLPSRQRPFAYVLARRCRRSGGLSELGVYSHNSDTGMCAAHKLVPVTLIIRHSSTSWSIDNILNDLRSRDTWRAKKETGRSAGELVDLQEAQEKQKVRDDIRDDIRNRSRDAWRSYQARTGQRNQH